MSMHNKTKDTLPSARRPHLNASSGKARHVNAHPSAAGSTNSTIAAVHVIAVTGMRRIPIKFVRQACKPPTCLLTAEWTLWLTAESALGSSVGAPLAWGGETWPT